MSDSGKIYITISDTRGGSGSGVTNDADIDKKDGQSTLESFVFHKFFNAIENEAKTFVNYSIGNIGNFTGNYQAQRDIQNTVSALSEIIGIGVTLGTTAVKYGPYGALAVGLTTLASKVTSTILDVYSDAFEKRRINRNIEYMRNRLGLEGLTNGSRSGGY